MKNGDQGWWFRSKYSTVLYNPGTAVMVVVVVIPTYRREVGDSKDGSNNTCRRDLRRIQFLSYQENVGDVSFKG